VRNNPKKKACLFAGMQIWQCWILWFWTKTNSPQYSIFLPLLFWVIEAFTYIHIHFSTLFLDLPLTRPITMCASFFIGSRCTLISRHTLKVPYLNFILFYRIASNNWRLIIADALCVFYSTKYTT
jgi:hypothetical protein